MFKSFDLGKKQLEYTKSDMFRSSEIIPEISKNENTKMSMVLNKIQGPSKVPRLMNIEEKEAISNNIKFEYFNNFNQVPKSVLNQIRPLTLGLKSQEAKETQPEKSAEIANPQEIPAKPDNIFLSINSGNRLAIPGSDSVKAFGHQNREAAGDDHERIRNINQNIFNSILGNIGDKRSPRSSHNTFFT